MIEVAELEYRPGTKEELLPCFDESFPCVSTEYRLHPGRRSPWHWHGAAELFYIEDGELEYSTPAGGQVFKAGEGGFLPGGVLHSSLALSGGGKQLLHIFDPLLVSGCRGSRIEQKYVLPLLSACPEVLRLSPGESGQAKLLEKLQTSFAISPEETGYELRLRSALSEIWLGLVSAAEESGGGKGQSAGAQLLKQMLAFIYENYQEKIAVSQIAASAHISERSCFELFRTCMATTPMDYLRSCRVSRACDMLLVGEKSVTRVAEECGLGSGSYFARVFRAETGLSPFEYRKKYKGKV